MKVKSFIIFVSLLSGACGFLPNPNPPGTPTPRPTATETMTPHPTATATATFTTVPTSRPTVKPTIGVIPTVNRVGNGVLGGFMRDNQGKVIKPPCPNEGRAATMNGQAGCISVFQWKWPDGKMHWTFYLDATTHFCKPGDLTCTVSFFPDVCDGHEPAWSTWCNERDYDAVEITYTAIGTDLLVVPKNTYQRFAKFVKGGNILSTSCPSNPYKTTDGLTVPVHGNGCYTQRIMFR